MKTILLILLIFMVTLNAFPQIDTTLKEFFPLHIGDVWQYRNENSQLLTAKIESDTSIAGQSYYVFKGMGLRTSGSGITRIDSLLRVVQYGYGDSTPIYRLDEKDGPIWPIVQTFWGLPTPHPLVRFNGITTMSIFGQAHQVMHFDFGGTITGAPIDTTFGFGALLAKGIGVIQEQYYDSPFCILQGAIIDNVLYGTIVSVDKFPETIPKQITLHQNYPNPFNPTTRIKYDIPKTIYASLKVYNLLGQRVTVLLDGMQEIGSYEKEFNASHLSSGVYIAVLQTSEARLMCRMLLIK